MRVNLKHFYLWMPVAFLLFGFPAASKAGALKQTPATFEAGKTAVSAIQVKDRDWRRNRGRWDRDWRYRDRDWKRDRGRWDYRRDYRYGRSYYPNRYYYGYPYNYNNYYYGNPYGGYYGNPYGGYYGYNYPYNNFGGIIGGILRLW